MKYFVILAIMAGIGGSIWYWARTKETYLKDELKPSQPEWLVIIPGITGDLAKRKLLPALYRLYTKGQAAIVIGTGRRESDLSKILEDTKKHISDINEEAWAQFSRLVSYQKLDPVKSADFAQLNKHIEQQESHFSLPGKRLVYLSLPSDVFCSFAQHAVENGIIKAGEKQYLLFEKPFGSDLQSAQEINKCLTALVPDKQLYRVDHYVAKGLTQTLPRVAQSNALLAFAWNGSLVESVSVYFHEKIGIEGRGHFYDRYGAIKDVVQNHMLQILAYYALGAYPDQTGQSAIKRKTDFLRSLIVKEVRRGQYKGYTSEKDVLPNSTTETYAHITLESTDPRWKGVKFYLETGKALAEKSTHLVVKMKTQKSQVDKTQANNSNELVFHFAPIERITLPVHGLAVKLINLATPQLDFTEAYEAIFKDVFDETLRYTVSFPEIEAQWHVVDAIEKKKGKTEIYDKGFKS